MFKWSSTLQLLVCKFLLCGRKGTKSQAHMKNISILLVRKAGTYISCALYWKIAVHLRYVRLEATVRLRLKWVLLDERFWTLIIDNNGCCLMHA